MLITTKIIENIADFAAIDAIYQKCFGNDSVPTSVQFEWWQKYPQGIIGLLENNTIIGGMSFWPLHPRGFDLLNEGLIKEKELTSHDIDTLSPKGIYISEIAIAEKYRGKQYSQLLLQSFLQQSILYKNSEKKLPMLALAYSIQGKSVLQKTGFRLHRKAEKMPDLQDLFILD